MPSTFTIPDSKRTPAERLGYCLAAQEKLRRLHNEQSAALPEKEMRAWIKGSFKPCSMGIARELLHSRAEVEADETLAGRAKALQVTAGRLVYPPGFERWHDRCALLWAGREGRPGESTPRDEAIVQAIGEHKFAPPEEALAEVVLPGLDAAPAGAIDPYEDFTDYTEQDANGRIGVAENLLTITGLTRNEDAWVYRDMGAGQVRTSFEHLVEVEVTSADVNGIGIAWAASNVIEESKYWIDNSSQAAFLYMQKTVGDLLPVLYDAELAGGDSGTITVGTQYYYTVSRADDALTVEIRTGSHAGVLVDTLAIAVGAARTYRYVFGANSYNDTNVAAISYTVGNLDLQEPFAVNASTGVITIAHPDFLESSQVWTVVVEVTDNVAATDQGTVTITLVPEAASLIEMPVFQLAF